MYWVVLVLTALVSLHLYQRLLSRRQRRMLGHLPVWTPLPFIGSSYKLLKLSIYNIIQEVSAITESKNLPFLIWLGNKCVIVLSDPEDVLAVSTTNLDKSYMYSFADALIRDGLISAPGSIWKRSILRLGTAFKKSTIESFQEIFNYQSQKFVENLEAEVNEAPFDIQQKYVNTTFLKTLIESIIGVYDVNDMILDKVTQSLQRAFELLIDRGMNICLHLEAVYRLTPAYREFEACSRTINNLTKAVLKKRLNDMNEQIIDKTNQVRREMSTKSFLNILLEMKKMDPSMTEEMIKCELTSLFLAGYDTISTNLNFVLLLLGSRADIQQKLYEEIKFEVGDIKKPIFKEDLNHLSYCEAVILETLRLYPPVYMTFRYIDQEVKIKSCTIPSGVTSLFNFWGSGRSKRVWGDDALMFKPERWLDPLMASKHATSFLSFSIGKRTCIGKRYAINLLKTILVHCVREYEFISEFDKATFSMDIMLRVKSGGLLQIRRRKAI